MTHEELKAITVEKLPGSEIKITGEIPYTYLDAYRKHAVEHVGAGIEMDGFRKGHIPESILIQRVGEMALLTDMAEHSIEDAYRKIVTDRKLDVIGHPKVSVTKLAKDNPLGFTITVAVVPEVTLPDYKKVAQHINKEKESKEVTEEEITKQVEDILRQKVAYERLQAKAKAKSDSEKEVTPDKSEEIATPNDSVSENADPTTILLPELTDEYVKTLGTPGQFETVAEFREKIKEHLTIQKSQDVDSNHRAKITDAILESTTVELPKIMIDSEIGQMFGQMEEDLKRAELKMDDYLTHIKKSREELTKEWTPAAEKRAKLQLVLNAIAKKDEIKADPSIVDHEVSNLLEKHKDADEMRVRIYVESVLMNEAVMKNLEEVK